MAETTEVTEWLKATLAGKVVCSNNLICGWALLINIPDFVFDRSQPENC
jgi:hypothetical protein